MGILPVRTARRGLVACLLTVCLPSVLDAAPRSHAAGYAQLRSLGLIDTEGARYVRVSHRHQRSNESPWGYQLPNLVGKGASAALKGNAWLLSENEGGTARVVMLTTPHHVTTLYRPGEMQKAMQAEIERQREAGETMLHAGFEFRQEGTWEEVDAETDLAVVTEALLKRKAGELTRELDASERRMLEQLKSMGGDANQFMGQMGGPFATEAQPTELAPVFLLAGFAHRAGHEAAADALAQATLALASDPRLVLLEAYNQLADVKFQATWQSFSRDCDWEAYRAGLQETVGMFSRGWRKAEGVKELIAKLDERAARLARDGGRIEGLSDAEAEWAESMARAERFGQGIHANWLFSPVVRASPDGDNGPAVQVARHRLRAVPFLIKILGDDLLIAHRFGQGGYGTAMHMSGMVGASEVPRGIAALSTRPATRGELARELLGMVVPPVTQGRRHGQAMAPETFADECRTWYDRVKDMSPKALAFDCLQDLEDGDGNGAVAFLLAFCDTPAERRELEEWMAPVDTTPKQMMALKYISNYGDEARAFAAELKEVITGSGVNQADNYQLAALKQQVDVCLGDESFEEILNGAEVGPMEIGTLQQAVAAEVRRRPPNEVLGDILGVVVAEDEPARIATFLGTASMVRYAGMAGMFTPGGDLPEVPDDWSAWPETPGAGQTAPAAPTPEATQLPDLEPTRYAAQWTALLEDDRSVGNAGFSAAGIASVKTMAAGIIHVLYLPQEEMMALQASAGADSPALNGVVVTRAREIVAGTAPDDLTPMPDASQVSAERLAELNETILTCPEAELPDILKGLDPAEQMAVTQDAGGKLMERLLTVSARIREPRISGVPEPAAARLTAMAGRAVDRKLVEELIELAKEIGGEGKTFKGSLSRRFWEARTELTVEPGEPEPQVMMLMGIMMGGTGGMGGMGGAMPRRAQVMVTLQGGVGGAPLLLPIEGTDLAADADADEDALPGAGLPPGMSADVLADAMGTQQAFMSEQFWESFERMMAGDGPLAGSASVEFGVLSAQTYADLMKKVQEKMKTGPAGMMLNTW